MLKDECKVALNTERSVLNNSRESKDNNASGDLSAGAKKEHRKVKVLKENEAKCLINIMIINVILRDLEN